MKSKIKILIVDDNQHVLNAMSDSIQSIRRVLDLPGAIVVLQLCHVAREAIEAIKKHKPDILFLDYNFQENTNGRDVAEWIDQHYRRPIQVATHTDRPEEQARDSFAGTKCVTYFMGTRRLEQMRNFLEIAFKKFYQ